MAIQIRLELEGSWSIGFVVENGKDRTREYLESLKTDHRYESLAAILTTLKMISDHGPPRNQERFRHEGDGLYAVKKGQERIYGFFAGHHFFACAAGATKKSRKPDKEILETAKRLKRLFEDQHRRSTKGGS